MHTRQPAIDCLGLGQVHGNLTSRSSDCICHQGLPSEAVGRPQFWPSAISRTRPSVCLPKAVKHPEGSLREESPMFQSGHKRSDANPPKWLFERLRNFGTCRTTYGSSSA